MRRYIALFAGLLMLCSVGSSQTSGTGSSGATAKSGAAAKSSAKKSAAPQTSKAGTSAAPQKATGGVPSRATVESFLRHLIGFDESVKWTIKSLGPSEAPGVSEITVHIQSPKGEADQKIFVTPSGKHAVLGQMQPFSGTASAKPSDEAINAFVRAQVGANPGITWSIAEIKPNAMDNLTEVQVILTTPQGRGGQRFWVTADGKHALFGELGPFAADPYAAIRTELARGVNGPAKGPANAATSLAEPSVTIVEFADLQCPSCKAAAPIMDRLLKDVPTAKLIFQQFPLTQIHKWAYKAAEFGDCVAHQNNTLFWKFLDNVYAHQEELSGLGANNDQEVEAKVVPKLIEFANQSGADGKSIAACANQPATAKRIDQSVELGRKLEVTGTPTLFVNGRRVTTVGSMPYDTLKKLVEFMGTKAAK